MQFTMTEIISYCLGIILSLAFVLAGKTGSDDIYFISIMIYAHLMLSGTIRNAQMRRRLKKYKKALAEATELIRSTEQK